MNAPSDPRTKTALRLPRALRAELERRAVDGYPDEVCGLLLGRQVGASVEVVFVRRARNLDRARARDRYEVDPAAHLAAQEEAQELGLDVIGVWHSHPDHPARPSETDRTQAWSSWSYVIVSVERGAARELRSWRLVDERFFEEEILP